MFSKSSRYQKLSDITTTDAKGRSLPSISLRLLPEVTGTFFHTVEEVDRLDHLAYKYYKKPGKWWRICDANPDFMSPQALLGKEPVVTDQFPLITARNQSDGTQPPDTQPPWSRLLKNLEKLVGVESVRVVENIQLVEEEKVHNGQTVQVFVEHYQRALIITYNQLNVSTSALLEAINDTLLEAREELETEEESYFEVGQTESIGRVGKKIIIPPDLVG